MVHGEGDVAAADAADTNRRRGNGEEKKAYVWEEGSDGPWNMGEGLGFAAEGLAMAMATQQVHARTE